MAYLSGLAEAHGAGVAALDRVWPSHVLWPRGAVCLSEVLVQRLVVNKESVAVGAGLVPREAEQ